MATGRYSGIVARNVLRRIEELRLTRQEVSLRSGVSISFLSELTAGRANPSLRVLEALASALETSLALLVIDAEHFSTDFEPVALVLSKEHAATARRWAADAARHLKNQRS